jgi:hypothetical protein
MARHRRSIYALQVRDLISGLAISRLYSELSRLIAKPPTTLLSNNHDRAITIGGNTMSQAPTRTFDQAVLSAWQAELKAACNPIIKEQCLQQEPDLLPRFLVAIAITLFATGIAVSVLLIAAHNRPFSGEIAVSPDALLQILPQAGRNGSAG